MTYLSGVDRKLDRAREHLDCIKTEEARWVEAQREFITVKPDLDPHPAGENLAYFAMWVDEVVPIPKRVPLIVGDCIQNLRSALDHLTHDLVLAEGGTPTEYTLFPLYEDRIVQHGKKPHIRNLGIDGGVDSRALAFIEEAQPYNRVDDPTLDPLWILNEFSNIDKHRLPVVVGEAATSHKIWIGLGSGGGAAFTKSGHVAGTPLTADTKLGGSGVNAEAFQQYPYVKGEAALRITFGQGEVCAGQPVTDVLEELAKAVRGLVDSLRLFTLPPSFRPPVAPSEPPIGPEIIARVRAISEARGEAWPWTEGPLAVPADHEWLASQDFPPGLFGPQQR